MAAELDISTSDLESSVRYRTQGDMAHDGHSTPEELQVKSTRPGGAVSYIGTYEQLLAAGVALPSMFPTPPRTRSWSKTIKAYQGIVADWFSITATRDGRYQVTREIGWQHPDQIQRRREEEVEKHYQWIEERLRAREEREKRQMPPTVAPSCELSSGFIERLRATQAPEKKAEVIHIAPPRPDRSSLSLLDQLYQGIVSGKVVGLVVVALHRQGSTKRYGLSTSGIATDNPTLAVGAVSSCQALLQTAALEDAGLM